MMPTGDPIDRAIVFLRGVRALLLEPRAVARVLDRGAMRGTCRDARRGGGPMKNVIVALGIVVLAAGCTFNITSNITGTVPARPGSGLAKSEEGSLHVYPPQLRAGDIITDERSDEWELISGATKAVGSLDFIATVRRVDSAGDSPAETREARWRAQERVKIRRSVKDGEAPANP